MTIRELRNILEDLSPLRASCDVIISIPGSLYESVLIEISNLNESSDEFLYFYEKIDHNGIRHIKYKGVSITQHTSNQFINITILKNQ